MRLHTSRSSRGAVIPIVALLIPAILLITAIAVDLGRERNERRDMQAAADVISLDMARLANGRTIAEIGVGDAENQPTEIALLASADRNDIDRSQLVLQWGSTDADGEFTPLFAGTDIPDTAEITASGSLDYFFQPGSGDVERVSRAQYGAEANAGFKVGSFGATVDPTQAGLLNAIITPLLGNPVGLDVLSYQGLAGASVNVFELGTELGLLTPDDVLNTTVGLDEVLLASADILERNGDTANATLLRNAINTEIENLDLQLGQFVETETGGEGPGMAADLSILDILAGTAFLSQCSPDPAGFEDCSGLSLPALSTSVPLLSSNSSLKVIQGAQYAYGPINTTALTGQVQLGMDAVIGGQPVGNCVPSIANALCLLSGLGLINQVAATITVDLDVTLAGGINQIADIGCTDPAAETLLINSITDLYNVTLNITVAFGGSGGLGNALANTIGSFTLSGSTSSANAGDSELFTVPPDVLGVTTRQTGAGDVGLSGLSLTASGNTSTVLGSLANLGINFLVADVTSALVNPLIAQIDSQVLGPLTDLLGANVTGSDLTPMQIDCTFGNVKLVG